MLTLERSDSGYYAILIVDIWFDYQWFQISFFDLNSVNLKMYRYLPCISKSNSALKIVWYWQIPNIKSCIVFSVLFFGKIKRSLWIIESFHFNIATNLWSGMLKNDKISIHKYSFWNIIEWNIIFSVEITKIFMSLEVFSKKCSVTVFHEIILTKI